MKRASSLGQLELFGQVAAAYADSPTGRLTNSELYAHVARVTDAPEDLVRARVPIGRSGTRHNVFQRALRWHQQSLRRAGVLTRVDGQRGVWELASVTPKGLHEASPGTRLIAFSTTLGVAIWGDAREVFNGFTDEVSLCVSSPPFWLRKGRAYDKPRSEREYIDFIVSIFEPIVRTLVPGGSICIDLGVDVFERGTPARSLYLERLTLALHERLNLHLMDRFCWVNPSKAPGPVRWASMERVQLNASYQVILWFTNSPEQVRADNRRVLLPHTKKHQALIDAGGESRSGVYSDGAYRIHPGRFGNQTPGRIPRNVLTRGARCADSNQYRKDARRLGLPVHGAMMPIDIPDFLIRFLTEPGELVVDPCGGTIKTGRAAERLGRRWACTETVLDYLRGSGERFIDYDGFEWNGEVEAWPRAA